MTVRKLSQSPAAIRMRRAYLADPDVFRWRVKRYRRARPNVRHAQIVAAIRSGATFVQIREDFGLNVKQLAGHISRMR